MGPEADALGRVAIRTDLRPGDLGYLVHMHGLLYAREYGYRLPFESFVARSVSEFAERYDPELDRLWVCESEGKIIGTLAAMHRDSAAQLRFFLLDPPWRGKGLGRKLMGLFRAFLEEKGYRGAYLWTTAELTAAQRLYLDAGFRLTEERESPGFGPPVIERRYELSLP